MTPIKVWCMNEKNLFYRQKGRIVAFMPEIAISFNGDDSYFNTDVTAVVIWEGGNITTMGLRELQEE